jgi:hypothetical protein
MGRSKRVQAARSKGDLIEEDFVAYLGTDLDTDASTAQVVCSLNTATASGVNLQQISSEFANFCDMYRLARLDSFELTVIIGGLHVGSGSDGYINYAITYVPPGADNPTTLAGIETPHHVLGLPGVLGAGTNSRIPTGAGNPKYPPTLKMPGSAFVPLEVSAGPGRTGWIPTQADGPDTTSQNWGAITIVSTCGTTASGSIPIIIGIKMRVSFYELLDPSTIAKRRALRVGDTPSGCSNNSKSETEKEGLSDASYQRFLRWKEREEAMERIGAMWPPSE